MGRGESFPTTGGAGAITRNAALPGADGNDSYRARLENKHADVIAREMARLLRVVIPRGSRAETLDPEEVMQRYRREQGRLREALVDMLSEAALAGARMGRRQVEALMGVGRDNAARVLRVNRAVITGADWDLVNQEVLDWVLGSFEGLGSGYGDTLAASLVQTSEGQIRHLIADWIRTGAPLYRLEQGLMEFVFARERAHLIASTEVTRAYAEGNMAAWRAGGIIQQRRWETNADELVCPICAPLQGQVRGMDEEFDGGIMNPPAHPRCRCFVVPFVEDVPEERGRPVEEPVAVNLAAGMALRTEMERRLAPLLQTRTDSLPRLEASEGDLSRALDQKETTKAKWYKNMYPPEEVKEERDRLNNIIRKARKDIDRYRETLERAEAQSQLVVADVMREKVPEAEQFRFLVTKEDDEIWDETMVRVREAAAWISSVTRQRVINAPGYNRPGVAATYYPIGVTRARGRASAGEMGIEINNNSPMKEIVHELGHALESASGAAYRAKRIAYYERRTAGETPQKMKDITGLPMYGDHEVSRPDKWYSAYIGKVYNDSDEDPSSEMISMGLDRLYTDPAGLFQDDPEYADFIIAFLSGDL